MLQKYPHMNTGSKPQGETRSKIDAASILRVLFGYEDYLRLMALLFLSGLMAGVCYFIFATATFQSTGLIRVSQFIAAAATAQGADPDDGARGMRALAEQLTSASIVLEAARKIGIADSTMTYDQLKESMLPVFRVAVLDSNYLEVQVLAFDPKVVKEMPQAVLDSYETVRSKLRNDYRDQAIRRYAEEVAEIRKKVTEQMSSKLKFEEQSALASAQIEMERLSNLPVELVSSRYRLREYEEVAKIFEEQRNSLDTVGKLALISNINKRQKDPLEAGRVVRQSATASPYTFSSPTTGRPVAQVVVQPNMVDGIEPWAELEKRKRSTEESIRMARTKYLDDHPEVRRLRDELKEVEAGLELELGVALKAFELEQARLKQLIADLESKLPDYYKATRTFDEKRLDYDLMQKSQLAWDKAYEKLSKRMEGLQFEDERSAVTLEFQGFTNLRAGVPVSPNKSKLLMMGCLLGLGLAGGVPFMLRQFDSSVMDLNEFENTTGIPGIGLVPKTDKAVLEQLNRAPTVGAEVPNALLENFRLIRSSILLNVSPKGPGRVIMLTSARPGDGKTTVSANVAWAFSSLGDRTLLIDCDLRRGRAHDVAGVSNAIGLTNVLTGMATLDECVLKAEAENLWVLPRGPVIAGTTELLNSGVFSVILDKLKGRFDRIILDTPPVLGLSETAFLQNHADGVVVVARCGVTLRKDVEDAVTSLRKLGAHFYGFVLNCVDFTKRRNHYYYYYYSSSYYDTNWEERAEHSRARASVAERK